MNLINTYLIDTINSNICSNEMPKWARDEKIYLCEPPNFSRQVKAVTIDKQNSKRLFWRSIVNIK